MNILCICTAPTQPENTKEYCKYFNGIHWYVY